MLYVQYFQRCTVPLIPIHFKLAHLILRSAVGVFPFARWTHLEVRVSKTNKAGVLRDCCFYTMENYIVLEHIGEGSFGKVYKVCNSLQL